MLYRLSKLIPVRMRSNYPVEFRGGPMRAHVTWWQWRGRVWRYHHLLGAV